MHTRIETALSVIGLFVLLVVMPALSFMSSVPAAPTFKGATGGAVVVDHLMLDGFEIAACPAGRIATTVLSLRYDGYGRKLMDVTKADNIFGYNSWTDPIRHFPWKQNHTIFWSFPRTAGAYVAAEFAVPPTTPPNQWGRLQNLETIPGPGTDWALSQRCGDFSPAAQYCASSNVITGRAYGNYKLPGAPVVAGCTIRPGERWYMMFRLHNPAAGGQNCAGSTCQFGVQNNHNP